MVPAGFPEVKPLALKLGRLQAGAPIGDRLSGSMGHSGEYAVHRIQFDRDRGCTRGKGRLGSRRVPGWGLWAARAGALHERPSTVN